MILKRDNFWLGFVLGLITPALGIALFKFINLKSTSWSDFFRYLLHEPGFRLLSTSLTLSLVLNVLIFTLYLNTRRDKTAKGVFYTTVAYGLIVLIIKTFA